MPTKRLTAVPNKPSPEIMSEKEAAAFFGEDAGALTRPLDPGPERPSYDARDFKAALLTEERVVIYVTAEFRKGTKIDYYIFRNPLGSRALVFPADAVLETGIEGLVDQETLDRAAGSTWG